MWPTQLGYCDIFFSLFYFSKYCFPNRKKNRASRDLSFTTGSENIGYAVQLIRLARVVKVMRVNQMLSS